MSKNNDLDMANLQMKDEIAARLLEGGTTKEKAVFICHEYFEKQRHPDEVAQSVIESVPTDERRELVRLIYCYDILAFMTPYFGLGYAEYRAQANETVGILLQMEQYKITEELLNSLYYRIDANSDKAARAKRKIDNILNEATAEGVTVKRTKSGEFRLVPEKLERELKSALRACKYSLSYFKAVIEALEDWSKANNCEDMLPPMQRTVIQETKSGRTLSTPKYSKQYIIDKERRGEAVTDEERSDAVIPAYDEVATNKEYKKLAVAKLKSNERGIHVEAYYRDLLNRIK